MNAPLFCWVGLVFLEKRRNAKYKKVGIGDVFFVRGRD